MSEPTPAAPDAAATPAAPGPAPSLEPGPVRWLGRPVTRVVGADVRAGLLAGVSTALVLGVGLPARAGATLEQALALACGYGAVVGLAVALARAAGAGKVLVLQSAFLMPLGAAAVVTRESVLLIPALLALFTGLMLLARWRQRRGTSYEVAGRRVTIVRPGYTVVFDMTAPPRVVGDRFGGALGDLDFGPVDAKLVARTGAVFKVVGRGHPLERVADPARTAELLGAALRS